MTQHPLMITCRQAEHAKVTAALAAREQELTSSLTSASARISDLEGQLAAAVAQHQVCCTS